ncbi:phage holin family protein [bacterium]|nr:phage holin family protein [bacterium]
MTDHGRRLLQLLAKLIVNSLALVVADRLFAGFHLADPGQTIAAAVLLALVNAYLRPLVLVLTLPVNLLTLGLFTLVVNAAMLSLVTWLLPGCTLEGFWTAVGAALVISVVSVLLNWFLQPRRVRVHVRRG